MKYVSVFVDVLVEAVLPRGDEVVEVVVPSRLAVDLEMPELGLEPFTVHLARFSVAECKDHAQPCPMPVRPCRRNLL
jgi:hypothetical protein